MLVLSFSYYETIWRYLFRNSAHNALSLFGTNSSTSYVQIGYAPLHETDEKVRSIHCVKMKE